MSSYTLMHICIHVGTPLSISEFATYTVSSDFLSAFVDCQKRFRLPPIRCETKLFLTDKWQSKTLFLAICDPGSSLAQSVFDCHLSGVIKEPILW